MRLVAFKAQGFKSFSDPVSFVIKDGVTGIVGPNGCGKSNFVDAIRWALGESRITSLRGKALPDVLFNGSENRPPADWCAVDLRFANDSGRDLGMWSNCTEIIVRRELNRDGQSFFYINGQTVRRRDVINLFRGTGVSPKAYGVVEQGMVSKIAEASPEELRAFVEEAAGVSHYKDTRLESERHLKISEENLQQIEHLSAEIDKRVGTLKKQARSALRHQELGEQINESSALLVLERVNKTKEERVALAEVLMAAKKRLEEAQKRFGELKEQESAARNRRENLMREADENQAKLSSLKQAAANARRDWENVAQTRAALKARIEAASVEKKQSQQLLEGLVKQQTEGQKTLSSAEAALTEETRLVAEKTAELEPLRTAVSEKLHLAEIARSELLILMQKLETDKMRHQMLSEYSKTTAERLAEMRSTVEKNKAAIDLPELSIAEEETQVLEVTARLAEAEEKLRALKDEIARFREAAQEIEKTLIALNAEEDALSTVRNTSGEWLVGVDTPPRLSHVLQVQAGKWAVALDAALGYFAASFAVPELSSYIDKSGLPPTGVMLVETDRSLHQEVAASVSSEKTLLINKLQIPEKSRAILSAWLAGVYVADNADEARTMRETLAAGEKVVSKDGVVYMANAVYVHGDLPGGYDWEQRLTAINTAISDLRLKHKKADTDLNALLEQAQEGENERDEAARILSQAQEDLAQKRMAVNQWLERRNAALLRCQELEAEIKTAGIKLSETEKDSSDLNVSREHINEQIVAAEGKSQSAESDCLAATGAMEELQADVHRRELNRRELEVRLEGDKRRKRDLLSQIAENERHITTLTEREQHSTREVEASDEQVLKEKYEQCERAAGAVMALVEEFHDKARGEAAAAASAADLRENCYGQMQAAQEAVSEHKLKDRELAVTVDGMNDSLEDFSVSKERLVTLAAEKPLVDAATRQAEIEELQKKRQCLGAINFAANSELRECEDTLKEQEEQCRDIKSAIAELRVAIESLDEETRKRMTKMLESLNCEFSALFNRFFKGGEARLEIDGDSILSAGFEIRARPPGKRLFSVRALSGGEKAVTALAFIFSMLRLNPPPFCIMDEVDAPLDEMHTENFTALLKDMSAIFQCLVITHNKGTLEQLPHLIGVTQEERGISKVVSVSLTEALQQIT